MRSISVRLIVTSSFAIGPTSAQHLAGKSGHFYLARTGHLNFCRYIECADNKYYVNFGHLSEIINGKRGITAETAWLFSDPLGT